MSLDREKIKALQNQIKEEFESKLDTDSRSPEKKVELLLETFWGLLVPKQNDEGDFFLDPKLLFDELPTLGAQLLHLYVGVFLGKGGVEQKSSSIEEITSVSEYFIRNQFVAIQSLVERSGGSSDQQLESLRIIRDQMTAYIESKEPDKDEDLSVEIVSRGQAKILH